MLLSSPKPQAIQWLLSALPHQSAIYEWNRKFAVELPPSLNENLKM